MKTVIVFSGKMGGGKSYFSWQTLNYLKSKGYNVRIISIAGKLKKVASVLTDSPIGNFYRKKNEEWRYGITNGKLLQILGQGLFTMINKNLWIDILIDKVKRSKEDIIIVDDMRYLHEYDALSTNPYIKLYHIHLISSNTRTDGRDENHQSETESSKIPAYKTITNDRTPISIERVLQGII